MYHDADGAVLVGEHSCEKSDHALLAIGGAAVASGVGEMELCFDARIDQSVMHVVGLRPWHGAVVAAVE